MQLGSRGSSGRGQGIGLAMSWALWLALIVSTVFLRSAQAEDALSPDRMQTGSLLLQMESGYIVATRMNTDVRIQVSGLVARVTVRQEFRNEGSAWAEGVYVFPLPDRAAVDRLRLHVGERFIEGEVREKEKAKKEYEAAKKQGKKASLVQQQRANLFTTSVANIGPGEEVAVEIEYLETLAYDEGVFSLRFPMTMTPRYIPGTAVEDRQGSGWADDTTEVDDASLITPPVVTESNDHKITLHAEVTAGVPLEYIASRYHPIDVTDTGNRYELDLTNTDVPMDHDFELAWRPRQSAAPRAMLFEETIEGQPHVLLMMIPPNDASVPTVVMARELVFVIDTSGSMHGTSMEQARKALLLALNGLRPVDRFNVIQFNSVTDTLFPNSAPATASNIKQATNYVKRLQANGGTEIRPALQKAFRDAPLKSHLKQIIFITDGSVGNEQDLFRMIESDLSTTRLFTIGIGSAPNGWFMRKAAEAGRGTYVYISALHEVDEKMGRLFRKLENPQVTDIDVQWPDGVFVESYPDTIPDLYAGEPVLVKSRMDRPFRSSDLVTVSGTSAMGAWGTEMSLDMDVDSPGIAALWARARIEDLMDRQRRGADPEKTRLTVIETALTHHLVSKYTSLVAVDKTPVRPANAGLRSDQVPSLLPHGQSQNAIFGFPATASGAPLHRALGMLFLLLALALLWLRRAPRAHRAPA